MIEEWPMSGGGAVSVEVWTHDRAKAPLGLMVALPLQLQSCA